MRTFLLGCAVAVFVNLFTSLFDRGAALTMLPWVAFYILIHGVSVLLGHARVHRVAIDFARRYPPLLTYVVVMGLAAVLAGLYWRLAVMVVARAGLMVAQASQPLSPTPAPDAAPMLPTTSPDATVMPIGRQSSPGHTPARPSLLVDVHQSSSGPNSPNIIKGPLISLDARAYVEPAEPTLAGLRRALKTVREAFPDRFAHVRWEAGNRARERVGQSLGRSFGELGMGEAEEGSVFMTSPAHALTIQSAGEDMDFASALVAAIAPFVSTKAGDTEFTQVQPPAGRARHVVVLHLGGEPTFAADGSVRLE